MPKLLVNISLERNEPWWVGGTNTRFSVFHWLVWDWELNQIMPNHFRLDFKLIESIPIVHSNNASNYFKYYDRIVQMGSDWFRLLTRWGLTFRLAKLFDQGRGLSLQSSLEPSSSIGVKELDKLINGHAEKCIQIDTLEVELPELSYNDWVF